MSEFKNLFWAVVLMAAPIAFPKQLVFIIIFWAGVILLISLYFKDAILIYKKRKGKKMLSIYLMGAGVLIFVIGAVLYNSENNKDKGNNMEKENQKIVISQSGSNNQQTNFVNSPVQVNIGKEERHLTKDEIIAIDKFSKKFKGQKIEVRMEAGSDLSFRVGRELIEHLKSKGIDAFHDETSTYGGGALGNGISFFPNAPIIRVGRLN